MKVRKLIINLVVLLIIMVATSFTKIQGQEFGMELPGNVSPIPTSQLKPIKIKMGIHLIDISEVDFKANTCKFDFYLLTHPERPFNTGTFRIANANSFQAYLSENQPLFRAFRVHANTRQAFDFSHYPFMRCKLYIAIEDRYYPTKILNYVVDPQSTAIDRDFEMPGWISYTARWLAKVVDHPYPSFHDSYSRYIFMIPLARNRFAGFINDLMPAIIFVCAGLSALFYRPWKMQDKIVVLLSAILASILHQQVVKGNLPSLGYLTYFDKFIITNYAVLLLALLLSTWQTISYERYGEEYALKYNIYIQFIVIVFWILAQLYFLICLRKEWGHYVTGVEWKHISFKSNNHEGYKVVRLNSPSCRQSTSLASRAIK